MRLEGHGIAVGANTARGPACGRLVPGVPRASLEADPRGVQLHERVWDPVQMLEACEALSVTSRPQRVLFHSSGLAADWVWVINDIRIGNETLSPLDLGPAWKATTLLLRDFETLAPWLDGLTDALVSRRPTLRTFREDLEALYRVGPNPGGTIDAFV